MTQDRNNVGTCATGESIYTDGSYVAKTGGTWHLEDSSFKARRIASMLARHVEIKPNTVCEIGCGAGGILAELQKVLPDHITFTGYDISPQAHALSARFSNPRCQFILGDAFADHSQYDLVLVMDVIEHVEDCFSFLRHTKQKGEWKLYHIPLDAYASGILRGNNSWDTAGHLNSLKHTGHRVADWMFTDGAIATPRKTTREKVANLVRRPLAKISTKFAARLMGGYSMLVLAK
jgi:SAM-dependent methyltransferase